MEPVERDCHSQFPQRMDPPTQVTHFALELEDYHKLGNLGFNMHRPFLLSRLPILTISHRGPSQFSLLGTRRQGCLNKG